MARIAGVDLPRNKHVNIALTYIYGIGNPRAARILTTANVNPDKKVQDLTEEEVNHIRQAIENEGGTDEGFPEVLYLLFGAQCNDGIDTGRLPRW